MGHQDPNAQNQENTEYVCKHGKVRSKAELGISRARTVKANLNPRKVLGRAGGFTQHCASVGSPGFAGTFPTAIFYCGSPGIDRCQTPNSNAPNEQSHCSANGSELPPETTDALEELVGAVKAVEVRLAKLEAKGHAPTEQRSSTPLVFLGLGLRQPRVGTRHSASYPTLERAKHGRSLITIC
jgi:hypothetical protein